MQDAAIRGDNIFRAATDSHLSHADALAAILEAVVGQAKERQRESGGDVRRKTVPENLPEARPLETRDAVAAEIGTSTGDRGKDDRHLDRRRAGRVPR